jgi:hypothetical protein
VFGGILKKTSPKHVLVLLLIGIHIWQASLVRPVADDYTLLRIYTQEGFVPFVSYIWNNFGGNVTPAIIRALYLSVSLDSSNWYGFMAFSISTSLLVVMSYLVLITWLTNRGIRQITLNDLLISLLASLAFEGFFTPGLSSAYLFGAAAGVHLWPICIFLISLKLIETSSRSESKIYFVGSLGGFIFLGFLVGNSGLAESSAIFIALITLAVGLQLSTKSNIFSRFRLAINSHLLGVAIGLATILLAPGFVNRNSRLGKIDEGALSLITGFRSALVSFSGEVLSHPIWLFGILVIPFFAYLNKVDKSKSRLVLIFFAINFVMLVLGSTFGYAAWHQSSGLIFLLTPASFCLPILFNHTQKFLKGLRLTNNPFTLTVVALALAVLLFRGLIVQENRSSQWDSSLVQNYCLAIESEGFPFLGAEIRYWPIGLGIEDVNRWDWMAQEYKSWLRTIEFKGAQICE